jgi:hypothetical protein
VLTAALAPVPRDLAWVAHRDVVDYRVKVRNAGVVTARGVRTCVNVGKYAEIVTAKGAQVRGRRACWTLSRLAKGESISRKLTVATPTRGASMRVAAVITSKRGQAEPVRLVTRLPVR